MKLWLRVGAWILAAAGAAGVIYWAFRPEPVPVELAEVKRGSASAIVEEDGRTRVRERYLVSSPLAGRLSRIDLDVGDEVKAGTPIAALRPSLPALLSAATRRQLEERLGGAEATLRASEERLQQATDQEGQVKRDLDRTRALRESGAVSQQQLDRDELAARVAERVRAEAELRRHASEHEVAEARALLERFDQPDNSQEWPIAAPIDGDVLKVLQKSERDVQTGEALLEIGDPGDLEIVVDVLTSQAVKILPGARAVITDWGGPIHLDGRVRLVEPAAFTKMSALGVEEQRVRVVIDILSPRDEWRGLGDGYHVTAQITTEEFPDAVILPVGALFRRGDSWSAFVVRNGAAHEVTFKSIRLAGAVAVLSDDVTPGDKVVLFPPSRLAEGMAIRTD